jgi:hypothetical protein
MLARIIAAMPPRRYAMLETQLLAEWLTTLPASFLTKTHINVGAQALQSNLSQVQMARLRAFSAWNDWADARVFAGSEVWLVEAKIVSTANAYGQLISYLDEYPASLDYLQFRGYPVTGIVLCAFRLARVANLFFRYNIRTILFTPSWAGDSLVQKVFGGQAPATL